MAKAVPVFLLLCVLVVNDVQAQKILSFTSETRYNACSEPNVAREFLDTIYLSAVLDPEDADVKDWRILVLYEKTSMGEVIQNFRWVDVCPNVGDFNYTELFGNDAFCIKTGTTLKVVYGVDVNPIHNNSKYWVVWVNQKSGSIRSKQIVEIKTVVPEEEILTINNVALDWTNPEIENTFDGKVSVIKYCMYQIDAHELSITFRDKTITSKDSCVSLNAVFLKSDIGQKISVGVEETAGICKRKRKRYFFLEQGKIVIDKASFFARSTNDNGAQDNFAMPFTSWLLIVALSVLNTFK
ncbi:hypothetical protein Bpfe_004336 [Biomphalaria pfeifferi]|uniref:Uncharacterized protein n=1 Tax=Biomphalaria pfeifferi TaxID=112525 RepID=A0AAD8FJ27_BIOPF|nr:hypothetical protein Bpfe_004336 [Biomphalaria pfeifferi]